MTNGSDGGKTVWVSASSSSTVSILANTAFVRTCRLGPEVFLDTRFGLSWYCDGETAICWTGCGLGRGFGLLAVKAGLMSVTIWIDSMKSAGEFACGRSGWILGTSLLPFRSLFSRRVCILFLNMAAIKLRREGEPLSFATWLVEPCGKGVVIWTSAWYSSTRGRYGLSTHSICPLGSRQKCPTCCLGPSFSTLGSSGVSKSGAGEKLTLCAFRGLPSRHSPDVGFDDVGSAKFCNPGWPAKIVKKCFWDRIVDLISPCFWVCTCTKGFDILKWQKSLPWSGGRMMMIMMVMR